MEAGNSWENDDGTMTIVKTEPEDVLSIEYDEGAVNEQSEFINFGNDEDPSNEGLQYGDGSMQEEFHFKQEGIDTGEDMEYRMESYPNDEFYPQEGPDEAVTEDLENWQYRNGFIPDADQRNLDQPGTSDISFFAEKREEKLYPCRYCDYVGSHEKLLSSHMNNRHIKAVVYQCPHCPYNSTISRVVKDHIETKHEDEDDKPMEIKRKCEFCDYSASNATVLSNHMNKHTKEKQHQCSFCNFNTLWVGYLKMHIRRKHADQTVETGNPSKEYPCQYCDYKALTPSTLKLHTNKHTREQEHQCPYCPYKTVWTTYIKLHIKNKHLKPEKSPTSKEHACNFCDYKAKNTALLKQHLNKHTREKVNQCPHCPFKTLWLTYMKLHIKRKHSVKIEGQPPPETKEFPCQYCSYKAISSSHLKIHENKHTKANEYKCQQCDFKTTWFNYLKLHTKRKHSVKEENPTVKTTYPCNFCSYKAINLSTLKVHQNKHTREVLYNCPHCDFKTTWRAYIKMHIEKHTVQNFKSRKQKYDGVKSFPCEYCDYKATQLGSLKLHINSKHTRNVMHKCPKCDYQCAVYGNLRMHIRRKHGLKPDLDGKYRCKECEFNSEKADEFRLHLNEKHDIKIDVDEIKKENDKVYTCQHCPYRTLYPQVMKKHINKHTRQNVIKCPHCPYTTVWNHYMKVHIRRHIEPKSGRQRSTKPNTDQNRLFPCQYCDHRSLSFSSLRDHINSVHTREVMHNCPYCPHSCTLKGNLKGHIRRKHPAEFVENEKRYPCGKCDFKTSVLRNLKIHLKREHDIDESKVKAENGEYQCQFCPYRAKSYYALKIHTNKHTKEHLYRCPQCEFATRWPNYLSKHIKQHSLNKRKVVCVYCDYKGCSTFRLRQHIDTLHKKDQCYPCPRQKCDFKTMHYPSLRIHLKGSIHADGRRKSRMSITRNFSYKYEPNEGRYFACDHCDYASKTQGNLDLHIKNKHDKKVLLKCGLCNYKTPSKSYLNRHFKVKHLMKKEEPSEDEKLKQNDNIAECKDGYETVLPSDDPDKEIISKVCNEGKEEPSENDKSKQNDNIAESKEGYETVLPCDDPDKEIIPKVCSEVKEQPSEIKRSTRKRNSKPSYVEELTTDEEEESDFDEDIEVKESFINRDKRKKGCYRSETTKRYRKNETFEEKTDFPVFIEDTAVKVEIIELDDVEKSADDRTDSTKINPYEKRTIAFDDNISQVRSIGNSKHEPDKRNNEHVANKGNKENETNRTNKTYEITEEEMDMPVFIEDTAVKVELIELDEIQNTSEERINSSETVRTEKKLLVVDDPIKVKDKGNNKDEMDKRKEKYVTDKGTTKNETGMGKSKNEAIPGKTQGNVAFQDTSDEDKMAALKNIGNTEKLEPERSINKIRIIPTEQLLQSHATKLGITNSSKDNKNKVEKTNVDDSSNKEIIEIEEITEHERTFIPNCDALSLKKPNQRENEVSKTKMSTETNVILAKRNLPARRSTRKMMSNHVNDAVEFEKTLIPKKSIELEKSTFEEKKVMPSNDVILNEQKDVIQKIRKRAANIVKKEITANQKIMPKEINNENDLICNKMVHNQKELRIDSVNTSKEVTVDENKDKTHIDVVIEVQTSQSGTIVQNDATEYKTNIQAYDEKNSSTSMKQSVEEIANKELIQEKAEVIRSCVNTNEKNLPVTNKEQIDVIENMPSCENAKDMAEKISYASDKKNVMTEKINDIVEKESSDPVDIVLNEEKISE